MSLTSSYTKMARESRGMDYSEPEGQRALDRDLDKLFRTFAAGIEVKYLSSSATEDLMSLSFSVSSRSEHAIISYTHRPKESVGSVFGKGLTG